MLCIRCKPRLRATMQTLNLGQRIPIRCSTHFTENRPPAPHPFCKTPPARHTPRQFCARAPCRSFVSPAIGDTPNIQPPPAGVAPPYREPTPPATVAYPSDWWLRSLQFPPWHHLQFPPGGAPALHPPPQIAS